MRFFLGGMTHFFQEIFFKQLGCGGRQRGKTQCDDVRRQVMGAKDVSDKL